MHLKLRHSEFQQSFSNQQFQQWEHFQIVGFQIFKLRGVGNLMEN